MSNDTPGTTEPAGAGISDEEMVEKVTGETSPDLQAEDVFEREADGTDTDTPAADLEADEVS